MIHIDLLLIIIVLYIKQYYCRYLRVDNNENLVTIDDRIDIKEILTNSGYIVDNKKSHSGTYNIVKHYSHANSSKVVLRETIDPILQHNKYLYNIEIQETSLLSKLEVSPHLHYAGYTLKDHGFMVLESYDQNMFELPRKNKHLFFEFESQIRNQIHLLLYKMTYNASIYNADMKIQNIVVKIRDVIDIRMIDFDAQYCRTTFDGMYNYEYHYKIDFSTNRVKMFQEAWYLLCCLFIEDSLRQYTEVTLLKDDILDKLLSPEFNEEHILAMSYIYYSDFMELIRLEYYENKNLYHLLVDNINTSRFSIVEEKIKILQYSRPSSNNDTSN